MNNKNPPQELNEGLERKVAETLKCLTLFFMDDIYSSSSRPLTCQQEVQISYRVGDGRIICPLAS